MTWDEFSDLMAGLGESAPIVRLAQVRTEMDPEALKAFSPEQRRERAAWQRRRASRMDEESVTRAISSMQESFRKMFGGDR